MKRLNTYSIYVLALRIHPLTELIPEDGMTIKKILFPVYRAESSLRSHLDEQHGIFSPSLKRSAGALLRSIYDMGFPEDNVLSADLDKAIESYQLSPLVQKAKEFETVLANELPGLATYAVSPKGIYSTDDLISHAEMHIPQDWRQPLSQKALDDVRQAGKCLAFEVSTASAFHMWRAVESVMDSYYQTLTGNSFQEAGVVRNWGEYIKALEGSNAETKITVFLDHIREEYRNPISHPDETLDSDEAFALFGAAMSVIGQILGTITRIAEERALEGALSGLSSPGNEVPPKAEAESA